MRAVSSLEALKYPIGVFEKPESIGPAQRTEWIQEIASFPKELRAISVNLSVVELNWVYRPEGWTIQEVIHHCADSHMNAFIRFKLALTEDTPAIKPYFEDKWAQLSDTQSTPVMESVKILEGLHARWVYLLKSLGEEDFQKEFVHPEHGARFSLAEAIGMYAWHSNHHLAHIRQALRYEEQF